MGATQNWEKHKKQKKGRKDRDLKKVAEEQTCTNAESETRSQDAEQEGPRGAPEKQTKGKAEHRMLVQKRCSWSVAGPKEASVHTIQKYFLKDMQNNYGDL